MDRTSSGTYAVVGYSVALLTELDKQLPADSVLVIEEPELAEARNLAGDLARFKCASELVTARTQDEENVETLAKQLSPPDGLRAVLPGLEYAVVAAAALADSWNLPGSGLAAARILRDKALLRERATQRDIPQPSWRVATCPHDVLSFRQQHGGQCVLKPTKLQASAGVHLLGPHDDIDDAWRMTTASDDLPILRTRHAATNSYLVEERLDGNEISVEALVQDGEILFRNVTDKHLFGGRHPVELAHVVPAALPAEAREHLDAAMAELVRATSFRSGILHAEWILVGDKPYLIECAGRIPGDLIPHLVDLAYRTDLIGAYIKLLEGGKPSINLEPHQAAAIQFLSAPAGVLSEVRGIDGAQASPGVREVTIAAKPGADVRPLTSSWSRLGYVVAVGQDPDEALGNVKAAASAVEFVLETADSAQQTQQPHPAGRAYFPGCRQSSLRVIMRLPSIS